MASFCGKDFVKLLPELDHSGNDFDWMFLLEKESKVINWMCRYIDSNYILEEHEMESYLEWEANNTFEDVENPAPNESSSIWGTLDDNTLLVAEIAASETLLICLPERAKKLKSLLGPSQEEARNSQHKCELSQQQCRLAEDGCRTFTFHLLESYSELVKDFENSALSLHYEANCEAMPLFLVHFPLGEMRNHRERWSNVVSSALTSVTSTLSAPETMSSQPDSGFRFIIDGDETSYKRLLKLIAMLVSKLLEATVESIFLDFDQESILATTAAFEDLLQQINVGNSIPLETIRAFDSICYAKIKAILQRTEKNKIVESVMNKLTEECKSSEVKYCLKIDRLNEISAVIQEQKELNLLMGILCQLDRATVQHMEKLLHCFIGALPDYEDKVKKESNLAEHSSIKREPCALQSPPPLPITLASLQDSQKCTVGVLRNQFSQANDVITLKQEEILRSIRLLLAYVSQKRQISNKLENYVISGATTKPVIIDYKYLLSLQDHEREYNKICRELMDARSAVEKLENTCKENPGCWTLRLLWVPFMNGNAERLQAIAAGDFSPCTIKKKQFGSHRKREWASGKKERV